MYVLYIEKSSLQFLVESFSFILLEDGQWQSFLNVLMNQLKYDHYI